MPQAPPGTRMSLVGTTPTNRPPGGGRMDIDKPSSKGAHDDGLDEAGRYHRGLERRTGA